MDHLEKTTRIRMDHYLKHSEKDFKNKMDHYLSNPLISRLHRFTKLYIIARKYNPTTLLFWGIVISLLGKDFVR